MSLNRYAKRRDDNEPEIIKALESIPGVGVVQLDRPVDLLVGYTQTCECGRKRKVNALVEVKNEPAKGMDKRRTELNEEQAEFFRKWLGQVTLLRRPEDARRVLGLTFRD